MPVEVENVLVKEAETRREKEAKRKEKDDLGKLLVEGAQRSVSQKVLMEWIEYVGAVEYRLRLLIPRKGWFSRTHKPLVAQVVQYTDLSVGAKSFRMSQDYDFMVIVYKQEDEALARNIVALLPLVYGDRIKIKISHGPEDYPWFRVSRSDGPGDDCDTYVGVDGRVHLR